MCGCRGEISHRCGYYSRWLQGCRQICSTHLQDVGNRSYKDILQEGASLVFRTRVIVLCTCMSATSTRQPTSQKSKAEAVAIPKIGDVTKTTMR